MQGCEFKEHVDTLFHVQTCLYIIQSLQLFVVSKYKMSLSYINLVMMSESILVEQHVSIKFCYTIQETTETYQLMKIVFGDTTISKSCALSGSIILTL
jgi:hypothetical protein